SEGRGWRRSGSVATARRGAERDRRHQRSTGRGATRPKAIPENTSGPHGGGPAVGAPGKVPGGAAGVRRDIEAGSGTAGSRARRGGHAAEGGRTRPGSRALQRRDKQRRNDARGAGRTGPDRKSVV